MKVDLDKIGIEGFEMNEAIPQAWLTDMLDKPNNFYAPRQDGYLHAKLVRVDDVVNVQGQAEVFLSAICSRCLGDVCVDFAAPLLVTMVPAKPEPEEDLGISTYHNRVVDLSAIVRDEIVLALPMRPLCKQTCAGLCVQCGKNLNDEICTCTAIIDSRWEALRLIKTDA